MRRRREVAWTEVAAADLEEALTFIEADDPGAAERMQRRVLEATARLAFDPRLGRGS
jgi:plasmid stabilization system protein ParE